MTTELKTQGSDELAGLNELAGNAFAKACSNATFTGHKEAFHLIAVLISESANPLAKERLETTKTPVQRHLAKAKAFAQSLQSTKIKGALSELPA